MISEQKYIKKSDSFELKDIFECGQCFRRNIEQDGSYTGIFKGNVLNVSKKAESIVFEGMIDGNINEVIDKYFDMNRDYISIKNQLSKIDNFMKQSIEYGQGIRILNQDLRETIISFMISANNNIPRIKGIIEKLCKQYGQQISRNGQDFYTFPSPEELKDVSISNFRELGLGFRDKRIFDMVRLVLDGKICLSDLYKSDTDFIREKLLQINGIGPKVADCILLFSDLKRIEVFPIDVRVRRVMNNLYIHSPDETKVNRNQILNLAQDKFGDLAGIAQEYLFYWARNKH